MTIRREQRRCQVPIVWPAWISTREWRLPEPQSAFCEPLFAAQAAARMMMRWWPRAVRRPLRSLVVHTGAGLHLIADVRIAAAKTASGNSGPRPVFPSRSSTLYGRSRRRAGCQSLLVAKLEIGNELPDQDAQDDEDARQQEPLEHQHLPSLVEAPGPYRTGSSSWTPSPTTGLWRIGRRVTCRRPAWGFGGAGSTPEALSRETGRPVGTANSATPDGVPSGT